jgi:hypothetical protein
VWNVNCDPNVRAAASRDGGATWQDVSAIPWNDVGATPAAICAGDAGQFFLAAPAFTDRVGWSVEVHEGRFIGTTFTWRRLTNPVPLPLPNNEAEPVSMDIEFDPITRNLYVAFTKALNAAAVYRTIFVRSTDQGETWEWPIELIGPESAGARIVVGAAGELTVIWENYVQGRIVGARSEDLGETFGPEFEVVPLLDPLAEPGSWYSEHGRRNPTMPANNSGCMQGPAAFSIAVDRSASPRRGTWYLVTTERASGTVGPQTGSMTETENNNYFGSADPVTIGNDVDGSVTASESVFDVDFYTFEGDVGETIWMNSIFFSVPEGAPLAVGLFCGGDSTTFSSATCMNFLRVGDGPPLIYTLPTTGRYYFGSGAALFYGIGYRVHTRSFIVDPSSVARDHRDILLCSSTDGGATWSPKVRVGDGPVGNEEAFPEVAVDDEGRVHVAWYDRRDAVECGAQAHTYWTWSDDGGQTFAPAERISEESSQSGNSENSRWAVGDHLGLATGNGKVYVVWTRVPFGSSADIWGAVISDVPTPVVVSGLRADLVEGGADLRWWLGDAGAVQEVRVHRASDGGPFDVVARLTSLAGGEQQWRDADLSPGVRYRYRIEVVTLDGTSLWEGPIELVVPVPLPGVRLAWRGATPNPFDEEVILDLATPDVMGTMVEVYDVTGHIVAKPALELAGQRVVLRWNGRDARNRIVAPGVYLIRAQLGGTTAVHRVVRMK